MLRIIMFGLLASAAEVFGGTVVILRKQWPKKVQEYLLALSAGFLLALVFFELFPESLRLLGGAAPVYMIIGFGLVHFFEHTIVGHLHFGEETHTDVMVTPMASISALSGLTIHAFFDGVAISAGMQYDYAIGLLVFLAIFLHKLPEGLTIASIMIAANRPRRSAFLGSFAISGATMLGILAVFSVARISPAAIGIAFAFSAGATTYVGAADLIPEINRSRNRIIPFIVFAGMLLFYFSKEILTRLIGTS
ncbi:MAG TPA: ZIP family metal transporter [Bacteroidota bacterium]|nr:ZIP family metal transporter [Bacteroidota bacterium]